MNDPRRWLDDGGGASPRERALLDRGLRMDPPDDREQVLWAAIGRVVGLSGPSDPGAAQNQAGPGSTASTASTGSAVKVIAAIGVVVGMGVAGLVAMGSRPTATAPGTMLVRSADSTSLAESSSASPAAVGSFTFGTSTEEVAVVSVDSLPVAAKPPQRRIVLTGPSSTPLHQTDVLPAADSAAPTMAPPQNAASAQPTADLGASDAEQRESLLREESRALDRARAALHSGNPSEALSRLRDMAKRFPSGVLGQEREVLTIEALSRSGQAGAASQQAAAFLKAHPHSPHAQRLRFLVRATDSSPSQ